MDFNKGRDRNSPQTALSRPLLLNLLFNNTEPFAVSQHVLADSFSIGPLTIVTIAVDHELVLQISLCYQQSGCDDNIVGAKSSLRKSDEESILVESLRIINWLTVVNDRAK